MRVVSALYHFCRNIMFWFRSNTLYSYWERYGRNSVIALVFSVVFGYTLKLLWRKKDGSEPGASDENTRRVEDSLDAAERSVSGGVKRPSGESGESGGKRGRSTQDRFVIEGARDSHSTPKETSPRRTRSPTNSDCVHGNDVREGRHANKGEERPEEEDFDSEEYRVETTDELYCDYDSTWETDPDEEIQHRRTRPLRNSRYYNFNRFERAARDMQNYRNDYPNQINTQLKDDKPNLNFYLGKTKSVPDGVSITDFHNDWHGDYDRLEYVHTYIQWLFPLQEPGVNCEASTLTKEEVTEFCNNSTAKENLLKSYKLMLDFYGIEFRDEETGEVGRAAHWEDRFNNLNSHTHNSLRITRILKCLGNLGYPQYQAPLVRFFLEETLVHGQLPNIRDSVLSYFMFAVLDKRKRRNLIKYAYLNYEPKDKFVWCPKKIQMLWSGQSEHRQEEALCNNSECEFDKNEEIQTST